MLRLITGRSGSGKTHEIIKRIDDAVADGKKVILIVPEQQVYSCERSILPLLPTSAGLHFEIVSFSRLAQKVFSEYGGLTHKAPSTGMKTLLMWRNLREISHMLLEFGKVSSSYSSDISLSELMLATVNEMKHSNISASQLISLADTMDTDSPLARKFRDIAVIATAYDSLTQSIYGANPADRLTLAAEKISTNEFFRDTTVFVDSFTSFTAQEYDILRYALTDADELCISLCIDVKNPDAVHFLSTADTLSRLKRLAKDHLEDVAVVALQGTHKSGCDGISAIEEKLWDFKQSARLQLADTDCVKLFCAENIYDEAEATALNIRQLVAEGLSYGDIAVVMRDTSLWEGVLDSALDRYSIPYFVSERTSISTKPLARLVLSSLRAIRRGWQSSDIMDVLKTGMCGISPYEIDMFEEYVFTWSISGKRMTDDVWSMNPDGYTTKTSERGELILQAANNVRRSIMTPLIQLQQRINSAENATDQCRAIYDYLASLGVKQLQVERAESLIAREKIKEAGEELRLWSYVCECLISLSTVMSDAGVLSAEDLEASLSILFTSTDVGSVPARHDCVIVGSAKTLRADNIKAALVIGLCEGEFPGAHHASGVFGDSDREFLANHGIRLGADPDVNASEELLYVYRALTLPSDKLYASYSIASTDGKKKSPSVAFTRLEKLFAGDQIPVFRTSMIHDRSRISEETAAVRKAYSNISGAVAKTILGDKLYLSQTQIKKFFNCPYSYYGSYILGLRERNRAELGTLNAGLFLHHVIEHFLKAALDENNSIRPLDESEILALSDQIITSYVSEICGEQANLGSVIHLFGRMRTVAIALIKSVIAELEQSSFRPFGFEVKFDRYNPDAPSPMTINLDLSEAQDSSDTVNLIFGGTADRVDFYRSGDKIYIRVIDYKSSAHDIDFSEGAFDKDLNVQLLIYLFAICSDKNKRLFATANEEILPASAMYVSYKENTSDGTVDIKRTGLILDTDEILEATSSSLKSEFLPGVSFSDKDGKRRGKALCPQDRIVALQEELRRALSDTARKLYGGISERSPSDNACKFCQMKSSCPVCVQSKNQF